MGVAIVSSTSTLYSLEIAKQEANKTREAGRYLPEETPDRFGQMLHNQQVVHTELHNITTAKFI